MFGFAREFAWESSETHALNPKDKSDSLGRFS